MMKYPKLVQVVLIAVSSWVCIPALIAALGQQTAVYKIDVPTRMFFSKYESLPDIRTAAAAGDAAAQVDLGLIYSDGVYIDGVYVETDYVQASHWLDLALLDLGDKAEQEDKSHSAYSGSRGLFRTARNAWLSLWSRMTHEQREIAASYSEKACSEHYHRMRQGPALLR